MNKPDIENTANGSLGQSTDSHMYNLMSNDHSQTQYRDNKNLLSHQVKLNCMCDLKKTQSTRISKIRY